MSESKEKQAVLLLPRLKQASDVKKETAGVWNLQPEKAFNDVATSLDYDPPGEVNRISSVPTMWARPLTMEMVLYDKENPLRAKLVEQWRGMLAALALAALRSFPITVQLIELRKNRKSFAKALVDLLPGGRDGGSYQGKTLYFEEGKHPWEDVYMFLWDSKPVGMSSPSTLVVPSEEGVWGDLPWWDRDKKMLRDPKGELSVDERGLLWGWLGNLTQVLDEYGGDEEAVNVMQGLISEFQKALEVKGKPAVILSDDPQFFGVPINRGALIGLNCPVAVPEQPSSVMLMGSSKKDGEKRPLLLYDLEMPKTWGEKSQNIWIHGGKTLASLPFDEVPSYRERWKDEVVLVEKDDLFLDELCFIDLESALPGGLLPDGKSTGLIMFNDKRVTPLIPLAPILLDYFTPQDLINRVKFQLLRGEVNKVRVVLTLPLTGVTKVDPRRGTGKASQDYQLFKDYEIKEENCLGDQLPVLEVWPRFQVEGWKEYYGFYYDAELGDRTFDVSFSGAKYTHQFKQGSGSYQMAKFDAFPEFIQCLSKDKTVMGLIFLKSPETVSLSGKWLVGVDFGTSFTNIYVNKKDVPEQLGLENLLYQVTDSDIETRLVVLFESFIPEDFIPQSQPLPFSSVLTTRGQNERNEKLLPIVDGRIYVPDSNRFEPQEKWIKTDLKWLSENIPYLELFIKVLALHITALAASDGVAEIEWFLSYPSAFSKRDKTRYGDVWEKLSKELEQRTGIKQNHPQGDNLRTESLAVAQYFADFEGHDLVYTSCIDLGGGTSDISIWADNELVHQCSVQLAGRDIFSQFLALNRSFTEQRLKFEGRKWKDLRDGAFNAKLDVWLRLESEKWLEENRTLLQDEDDLQGLVRLTAIGIAGLYYYVGIVLKVLYLEGKYDEGKITPVYIGGNGSRFLKWLDNRGKFDKESEMNELLSRMLSAGSEFEDTEQITRLSTRPKDEAACGLVMKGTRLKGMGKKTKDPVIAGESCALVIRSQGGEERTVKVGAESRLSLDVVLGSEDEDEDDWDVIDVMVSDLVELRKFLCEFHKGLKSLEIEEIIPLKGYVRSPDRAKNQKLWDDTQRELESMLLKMKEDRKKGGNGKGSESFRWEPPFILGLKALLRVLGKSWAGK